MQPAPQWTAAVERSCAAVVAAVRSAGLETEAEPFWGFLRQGGRPPTGSLPPGALGGEPAAAAAPMEVYEYGEEGEAPYPQEEAEGWQGWEDFFTREEKDRVEGSRLVVRRATGFHAEAGLQDCSVGEGFAAGIAAQGIVLCAGENDRGQLGTGDRAPREGLTVVSLPWPVTAVRCGDGFSVALRRGGAGVCSWGAYTLGRGGDGARPADVDLLPAGDPVAILEVGDSFVIAITASDTAYGWGLNSRGELALGQRGHQELPIHIPELSGRRIRRLACADGSLAEAEGGALLCWGFRDSPTTRLPSPRRVPADGIAYPLLSMAVCGMDTALVDAAGSVWRDLMYDPGEIGWEGVPRMVRVAMARTETYREILVALSVCGQLWDYDHCRRIGGMLPLGLLPCGGASANRILLVPDLCGGRTRLCLFARLAVRVGLPSDPLRVTLTRFLVRHEFITGPADDPFGWPARPGDEAQ